MIAEPHVEGEALIVQDIDVWYRGVRAVAMANLKIDAGERVAVVGPNGAGKTTLLNCISRLVAPRSGKIVMFDHNLLQYRPESLQDLGIGRTFQNLELFEGLSAAENVEIALTKGTFREAIAVTVGLPGARRRERDRREVAHEALQYFGVREWADREISQLSYGVQKMVEAARAIVSQPRLLLLDEPAAGLTSDEKHQFAGRIRSYTQKAKCACLVIDHEMQFLGDLVDRAYAMHYGSVVADGSLDHVLSSEIVRDSYLGSRQDA